MGCEPCSTVFVNSFIASCIEKSEPSYNQSKLANILFTRELARRLKPDGITVNAVHPGVVGTGLFAGYHIPKIVQKMYNWFALSKEQGAETSVYLATSKEVAQMTGAYFTKCRMVSPSKAAQNDEDVAKLWKLSELMTGLQSSSV